MLIREALTQLILISILFILGISLVGCGGGGAAGGCSGCGGSALIGINVTPSPSSAVVGTSQQLNAWALYANSTTPLDISSSVTWLSSNSAVVTISSNGLATAVSIGITTISAASGTISGTSTMTVNP